MLTWSNSDAPEEAVGLAGRRGGGAAAAQGHRISFNLPLQEIFNSRPYDLSVQAARHTFSEVVVEIRENGEEEQVIAVTYMWKCAVSNFKPKLRCPFFLKCPWVQFQTKIKVPLREKCSRQVLHKKARKSSPEGRRVQPKRGRGVWLRCPWQAAPYFLWFCLHSETMMVPPWAKIFCIT